VSTRRAKPEVRGRDTDSVLQFLAIFKATPAGARWITVHSHGDKDSKGQPVLIQEEKNGTWRVIGGAGGNLNYLKLRGVKSEKAYKREAAERAKSKREEKKAKRKAEKEAGVYESKQQARGNIRDQRVKAERQFIGQVAESLGWDKDKLAFDADAYPTLSDSGMKAAEAKHHRALLNAANKAVDIQRKALVAEAAERGKEALGEVPLTADDADTLSVQDLSPLHNPQGLGYSTDYGKRAEQRGLTPEALAAEKRDIEAAEPEEQRERTEARRASARAIADELKTVREPEPPHSELVDTERAVDLLKVQKALRETEKRARSATKKINDEAGESKAYVLEVGSAEDMDEKVQRDIENDLRTLKTRAFLGEVGEVGGEDFEKSLGRHIGVGAYNSLASLSLATTGDALVGRDVVDVLGIAGAAQVLARRLQEGLSDGEMADAEHAMQEYHRSDYLKRSEKALDEGRRWLEAAKAVELDPAADGTELAEAQELNAKRREAAANARRVLGTALGEMEANAALVLALGRPTEDTIEAPIGNLSIDDAIRRARAIGLERGDYQITRQGANTFLTVQASGLERLAEPVDREHLEAVREAQAIIDGERDEEAWMPEGFADRADLAIETPEGAVPQLAEPFAAGADMAQSIRDYIGGRTADGDPPAAIVADLLSQDVMEKAGDRRSDYLKALDGIVPLRDEAGKMIRAETHTEAFQGFADKFVAERYGQARAPIHRQTFAVGDTATEALHRALAETPVGTAAYKPIGELTRSEQGALRDEFSRAIAKNDDEVEGLRDDLEKLEVNEPERETDDMFGRGTNPAWVEWKNRRDELRESINGRELNWQKYVSIMGSPENAYAAMQDTVRSKVSANFAHAWNKLNPEQPLKIGRQVLRGNLNHLDAVSPEAREKRLAEHRQLVDSLRERIQGRYAAGGARDKMAAAREAQEAAEQAQMGFFSAESDNEAEPERPLMPDERRTVGHAAERQIAAMMPIVGKNFKPGQPVKLWKPSMNGRYINQQRGIRAIEANKRCALAQGVGSGKTSIGMGAFADLASKGKIKRGLFLVPSIVQGQFAGAALNFLEPGRFNWHASPGASRDERIAAYKDPKTDFSVVTHQAFRDDMVHLGAKQAGIGEREMSERLQAMPTAEQKQWMRGVMDAEGIDWQYLNVDEGHNLLDRKGKENSLLANVVDSLSANTEYYVNASVSGDMKVFVNWRGCLQYITMHQFSERLNLSVGEVRSGLSGIRVRCFDWDTMKMRWAPVTAIHKFDASRKKCYEIRGAYAKRIVVTEDHSCYVWRNGAPVLVKGGEVKETDKLVIETRVENEEDAVDELSIFDYIGNAKTVIFGDFPEIEEFSGAARYRYRNCGKHGPYLPFDEFKRLRCDPKKAEKLSSIRGDSWCKPIINLKNIAYLVGLYIGDGCMNGNSIQLVLHESEVDRILSEIKKIGGMRIKLNKVKKANSAAYSVRVQNYPLSLLFRYWFGGMHSSTKRVPSEIFEASEEVKREVLRGYEDSDGHRNKSGRVTFTSCNLGLVEDMEILLRFLGITSAIYKRPPPSKKRGNRFDNGGDSYSLSYTGGCSQFVEDRERFRNTLRKKLAAGETHKIIAKKFGVSKQHIDALATGKAGNGNGRGRPVLPLSKSAAIIPIREIRAVSEEYVYDISVDECANFVANGILTHNTADPVKNDASEAWSVLNKMNPERYPDRERFMRRYGVDAPASREALRREMSRYFYPGRIDPGVAAEKKTENVELSGAQHERISAINDATAKARLARMRGGVDVEAVKRLAPGAFEGVAAEKHEEVAKRYQQSLGILRDSALRRVIDGGEGNAKAERVMSIAHARRGKPGVVFAHSREAARHLTAELSRAGHRVTSITGADSAKEKDRKRRAFTGDDPQADILVATDAGAVGLNAQRGQWLVQYDVPQTAMTHAQRNGRIHRLGQKNNVELINLMADHPAERRAKKRLEQKYALRDVMTSPLEGLDDTGIAGFLHRERAAREQKRVA
jgi:intein/homing endonuclease